MARTSTFFLAALCTGIAHAQTLYQTGFEASEGFTLGVVNSGVTSQNSWQIFGSGSQLTGAISTLQAQAGTRSLEVDANLVDTAGYWFRNINSNQAGRVVRASWWMKLIAPTGTPTLSNSSWFGVNLFDQAGTLLTGLMVDNFDRSINYWNSTSDSWAMAVGQAERDQWRQYAILVDMVGRRVEFEVNGERIPEWAITESTSTVFGDADIHLRFAATDKAYFDDLFVESLEPGTLRGIVTYDQFIGSYAGREITVELRSPGSQTPLWTGQTTLNAAQGFSIATPLRGTYDIAIKGRNKLRRVIPSVGIQALGVLNLTATLGNGDCNGDNFVDLTDYLTLAGSFDKTSSDSDWNNPDGNGIKPSDSDLNGDDAVDLSDYLILASAFDSSGDA